MLNLAAESVDQVKNISATRQLGRVFSRNCSSWFLNIVAALKNLSIVPGLKACSRFSHPSGNPASWAGKLNNSMSIDGAPDFMVFSIAFVKVGALRGVVMMVVLTPSRAANIRAMSRVGIIWP
ncbi:unnamed protein product [Amaranthus hypochondriacus]